jgi:predicted dehydrogenase
METTRWGILGTGRIARLFAQGLQAAPGAELVAVGSRSAESAAAFLADVGSPDARAHASYQDLAQDEGVDIVYIASPHIHHKDNALLCLEGGRAVLVEKPFTVNAAEAHEVLDLARSKGLFCMEAMWMRFSPTMAKLRETLESGAIGQVRMIDASLGFFNDFDPEDRLFDKDLGGGSLLDLGVYPISFIMSLLGKPSQVSSTATKYESGVDEQAAVILTFDDDTIGVATCSLKAGQRNTAIIYGDKGSIEVGPLTMPTWMRVSKFQRRFTGDSTGVSNDGIVDKLRKVDLLKKVYGKVKEIVDTDRVRVGIDGNGYNYEAVEAGVRLAAGEIESPVMSHGATLDVMNVLDGIRAEWGLTYPGESSSGGLQ